MIWTQIQAVISRVLRNQIDLLDSVGDQSFRFSHDIRLVTAAMRAAHPRDDAEAARMIAAFGDSQVSSVSRRKTEPRCGEIRDIRWALVNLDQRGCIHIPAPGLNICRGVLRASL